MLLFVSRTFCPFLAVEDIPTRSENQQLSQACQGESFFMNKLVDSLYLGYVKVGVKPVVRSSVPPWFDKPFLFIFSDSFLRKVYSPGDFVDQIQLGFSPGRFHRLIQ
jgi:hypothetical protein